MLCLTLAKDLGWTNTRRHPEALPSSRQSGQEEETLPNVWSTRRTSQYDVQVWRGERGRDFTMVSGGFGGFSHLAVPTTLAFPAHLSSQGSDRSTSLPIPSLHPSVDHSPLHTMQGLLPFPFKPSTWACSVLTVLRRQSNEDGQTSPFSQFRWS